MANQPSSSFSQPNWQHDVFLSYSRADTAIMQRVRASLRASGLNVWTDERIPSNSPDWQETIENAIENTGCLLVLFSPSAKDSRWVRAEINYAEEQTKPIFRLLVLGDPRDSIPLSHIIAQRFDIRNGISYDPVIQDLANEIFEHLGIESPAQRSERLATEAEMKQLEAEKARQAKATALRQVEATGSQPATLEKPAPVPPVVQSIPFDPTPPPIFTRTPAPIISPGSFNLWWWIGSNPGRVMDYKKQMLGTNRQIFDPWFISTVTWLPLFILFLGLLMGTMPTTHKLLGIPHLVWMIVIVSGWLLTGSLGNEQSDDLVLFVLGSVFFILLPPVITLVAETRPFIGIVIASLLLITIGGVAGAALEGEDRHPESTKENSKTFGNIMDAADSVAIAILLVIVCVGGAVLTYKLADIIAGSGANALSSLGSLLLVAVVGVVGFLVFYIAIYLVLSSAIVFIPGALVAVFTAVLFSGSMIIVFAALAQYADVQLSERLMIGLIALIALPSGLFTGYRVGVSIAGGMSDTSNEDTRMSITIILTAVVLVAVLILGVGGDYITATLKDALTGLAVLVGAGVGLIIIGGLILLVAAIPLIMAPIALNGRTPDKLFIISLPVLAYIVLFWIGLLGGWPVF
ncbi:MAG: TIR domain-containing protein [Chloroflexi bacterium]|nr:TIR domain-containing protein [Chloroflexota bacterium]